jgi:hypothetical protein
MTTKEKVIGLVRHMPNGISMDKIIYNLHVMSEIERGKSDIRRGRYKSQEEMRKKYGKWLSK